jgi:Family of unknown function (DUF6527)
MTGKKLRDATNFDGTVKRVLHWCPGCEEVHAINIGNNGGPVWTFNGDYERPTFSPSILCFTTYDEGDDENDPKPLPAGQRRTLCHYFIRDGKIEFCGDSPHALAGQTVDLPDWPYAKGTYGGIQDD